MFIIIYNTKYNNILIIIIVYFNFDNYCNEYWQKLVSDFRSH